MSDNTDDIVWPMPTPQEQDYLEMSTVESTVQNPVLKEPTLVLMSGAHDLDVFVGEYIDNINYDDA